MEPNVLDNVKFEKQKAIARFNRFRRITRLWQLLEAVAVLALISWSSVRVPAVFRRAVGFLVEFSAFLLNHHVVFLIGNSIVVLLFFLCRQNDAVNLPGVGDLYDDYMKHSAAAHPPEAIAVEEGTGGEEEKHVVVCSEGTTETPQCDDGCGAVQKAMSKMKSFQSEKVRQEIVVWPKVELRRSETENRRRGVFQEKTALNAADIETLSNEEFQRTVDAFINKHWIRRQPIRRRFEQFQNYQAENVVNSSLACENVKSDLLF